MKQRFWLFTRNGVYYLQDSVTGKKESLHTKDHKHAEHIRTARNEAADKPLLGLSLGKAYLAAYDPALIKRTWQTVMDEFCTKGKPSSRLSAAVSAGVTSVASVAPSMMAKSGSAGAFLNH